MTKFNTPKIIDLIGDLKEAAKGMKALEILDYWTYPYYQYENIPLRQSDEYAYGCECILEPGSCEGIYLSVYLVLKGQNRRELMTLKTLYTSRDDYKVMGELLGLLQFEVDNWLRRNDLI